MIHPIAISDAAIWNKNGFKPLYFQDLLKDTDYVLCSVSAAEYMGLCSCTTDHNAYVLHRNDCIANNIAVTSTDGTMHTTISQTINDLLADNTMDEQVILESLAEQYFKNNYADLDILPENREIFNHYRPMAELYYTQEI